MLLSILLVLIFLACLGVLYSEGMWSNAIRLINVIISALLAVNFFEPLAKMLDGFESSYTYFWDFLSLWAVFVVSMLVLRVLTDMLSKVKVRFLKLADRIGSTFFAAWIGWVMVCFTLMTLHTAPLGREFLFDGFRPEKDNMFLGMFGPDRVWLSFTQKMSYGSFCRGLTDKEKAVYGTYADEKEREQACAVFDREGSFMPKYAKRRTALDSQRLQKKAFRVTGADLVKR